MDNYYFLQEIKDIFKSYKPSKDSLITEIEFNVLCDQIVQITKNVVDRISKEVSFCLLCANPKRLNAACLIYLGDGLLREKKALIIITPIIFGYTPSQNSPGPESILHEIAHYVLGHRDYMTLEDIDKKEKEADDLADKWIADYFLATDSGRD